MLSLGAEGAWCCSQRLMYRYFCVPACLPECVRMYAQLYRTRHIRDAFSVITHNTDRLPSLRCVVTWNQKVVENVKLFPMTNVT